MTILQRLAVLFPVEFVPPKQSVVNFPIPYIRSMLEHPHDRIRTNAIIPMKHQVVRRFRQFLVRYLSNQFFVCVYHKIVIAILANEVFGSLYPFMRPRLLGWDYYINAILAKYLHCSICRPRDRILFKEPCVGILARRNQPFYLRLYFIDKALIGTVNGDYLRLRVILFY